MARRPRVGMPSPPEWWGLHLYSYLPEVTLAGWVWEFMRRDRLKKLRPGQPVDVMNPNRCNEEDDCDLESFYRPWHDWPQDHPLLTVPSAVRWEGVTRPAWYRCTWHNVDDVELDDQASAGEPRPGNQWVDTKIDLNRSDAVIIRDMRIALQEARKIYPKPKRVNPRKEDWIDNQVLQVWDLREFRVSYGTIGNLPGMFGNLDRQHYACDVRQSTINAHNSAKKMIEKKGWQMLALQVDDVFPDEKLRP